MTPADSGQRVFERRRIWQVTDPVLAEGCEMLSSAAYVKYACFTVTIGIAGGGRIPAERIAKSAGRIAHTVRAQHNPTDELYQQATGSVTVDVTGLAEALNSRKLFGEILLVDDICGTGETFAAVTDALGPYLKADANIRTVALCRNIGSAYTPDLWLWDVADWVHFPWEHDLEPGQRTEVLTIPERVQRR
ncbi:hypothetical protein L3i22_061360 [Actinoplanes sp. L3-i22]|nr:hypothetical protein L3i22_061360 [Actinoplanes sp. L3-i22]